MMLDPYAELGVARDADAATIRKAYRKASKRAHPDAGGTAEKFRKVSKALDVLSDPLRRKDYDETGNIDDKPINNEQAEIMSAVSAFLDQVLGELDQQGIPWEGADLVQRMLGVCERKRNEFYRHREQLKAAISGQRKIVKRFHRKAKGDGENRMEALIVGRIAYLEGQNTLTTRNMEMLTKAQAVIAEYTFDAEKDAEKIDMRQAFSYAMQTVRF